LRRFSVTRRIERLPAIVDLFGRDDTIADASGRLSSGRLLGRGRRTCEQ
jgi:hypothetical protein